MYLRAPTDKSWKSVAYIALEYLIKLGKIQTNGD